MKVAMISPDKKSEKAISKISSYIVKKTKEKGVEIDLITYKGINPLLEKNILDEEVRII